MGNRSLLCGASTVEVNMDRYDELLHKEAKLEIIDNMMSKGLTLSPEMYGDVLVSKEKENV